MIKTGNKRMFASEVFKEAKFTMLSHGAFRAALFLLSFSDPRGNVDLDVDALLTRVEFCTPKPTVDVFSVWIEENVRQGVIRPYWVDGKRYAVIDGWDVEYTAFKQTIKKDDIKWFNPTPEEGQWESDVLRSNGAIRGQEHDGGRTSGEVGGKTRGAIRPIRRGRRSGDSGIGPSDRSGSGRTCPPPVERSQAGEETEETQQKRVKLKKVKTSAGRDVQGDPGSSDPGTKPTRSRRTRLPDAEGRSKTSREPQRRGTDDDIRENEPKTRRGKRLTKLEPQQTEETKQEKVKREHQQFMAATLDEKRRANGSQKPVEPQRAPTLGELSSDAKKLLRKAHRQPSVNGHRGKTKRLPRLEKFDVERWADLPFGDILDAEGRGEITSDQYDEIMEHKWEHGDKRGAIR